MPIIKIQDWNPIIGDDNPINTMYYRDVPDGFRLSDIPIPDVNRYPMLNSNWDRFIAMAERYYRHWEIVGITLADFFENINLSFDIESDKIEKILENMDVVAFKRNETTTRILNANIDNESATENYGTVSDTELAFDSINEAPSTKTDSNANANVTANTKNQETEITIIERYSGDNGLDWFNQLVDYYPNINALFINIFKDDFILHEVYTW